MQRVAAYCRVSTDREDQANSLTNQETYFREYIAKTAGWELAQIFVDTGTTGTSTKKREAFNRMIAAAMDGEFDLILTKEISRFARNTLDSIYYTRKLKEHGVGVVFLNDSINTMDPDAELRLTILSSIAQEESRKTSERVKWGQKRRMEQGVVFGRDLLGFDVHNGRLIPNQEGADTVRLIFDKFVREGKGTHVIARELREAKILPPAHMKQWSGTSVLRILRNEKMAGDLIQKKTCTPNYLTHEKKQNRGQEDFVILRDHHTPIVSRELFDLAQEELNRRAAASGRRVRHSSRHCLSGKIKCAVCGSSYVARTRTRKDGSLCRSWRCYSGSCCPCSSVREEDIKKAVQEALAGISVDRNLLSVSLTRALTKPAPLVRQSASLHDLQRRKEVLIKKQQKLIELYLSDAISKEEFSAARQSLEQSISNLQKEHTLAASLPHPGSQNSPPDTWNPVVLALISGEQWDDTFYRTVLDTVTIGLDRAIHVKLNGLPDFAPFDFH